jgi:hypothetical protein
MYGRKLAQSTISESLSKKYAFLDSDKPIAPAYRQ